MGSLAAGASPSAFVAVSHRPTRRRRRHRCPRRVRASYTRLEGRTAKKGGTQAARKYG